MKVFIQSYDSPCGCLILGSYADRLCLCDWEKGWHRSTTEDRLNKLLKTDFIEGDSAVIEAARQQLNGYFRHERQMFDLPLLFVGSVFQKMVWQTLLSIPYGITVTYADISRRIDKPKAVRAVANATGANAISIIVPCHRVIGSDHTLTGYGGGLPAKRYLLELESKQ